MDYDPHLDQEIDRVITLLSCSAEKGSYENTKNLSKNDVFKIEQYMQYLEEKFSLAPDTHLHRLCRKHGEEQNKAAAVLKRHLLYKLDQYIIELEVYSVPNNRPGYISSS